MPRLNAEDYIYATFAFASADEQFAKYTGFIKKDNSAYVISRFTSPK